MVGPLLGYACLEDNYVYKTTDYGITWTDISSNLPDFPVNNIQIDPDNSGSYYIATDGGVFATYDAGESWGLMGTGMPFVAVLDLKIHRPNRTMYAATFGRSQYKIQLNPSSGTDVEALQESKLSVYPNPAIDQVNISFSLENAEEGSLMIYDLTGKLVKTLHEGQLNPGNNQFIWDGTNSGGQRIPGTYICRLSGGIVNLSTRILLVD